MSEIFNINQNVAAARRDRILVQCANAESMIFVRFQKEGIHCYPDALIKPELEGVKFLGYNHRHIFHFKIWIDVFHNDRDLEFILFKRWLESLYAGDTLKLDHKSCEMIADELYIEVATKYHNRAVWIEVSEDNENGCFKKYNLKEGK